MMGRHGTDAETRLQRAAGQLKGAVTFLETIADEEGITVPREVPAAAAVIRQWTRSLGAREPDPPVTPRLRPGEVPARPRRRDGWRR